MAGLAGADCFPEATGGVSEGFIAKPWLDGSSFLAGLSEVAMGVTGVASGVEIDARLEVITVFAPLGAVCALLFASSASKET